MIDDIPIYIEVWEQEGSESAMAYVHGQKVKFLRFYVADAGLAFTLWDGTVHVLKGWKPNDEDCTFISRYEGVAIRGLIESLLDFSRTRSKANRSLEIMESYVEHDKKTGTTIDWDKMIQNIGGKE